MKVFQSAAFALVALAWTLQTVSGEEPGLSNEVVLISVDAGQTIVIENVALDRSGLRGLNIWNHSDGGKHFAGFYSWWDASTGGPMQFDHHAGPVSPPTRGGRGGALRWKNDTGYRQEFVMAAVSNGAGSDVGRLRLILVSDKGVRHFAGCDANDDHFQQVKFDVRFE